MKTKIFVLAVLSVLISMTLFCLEEEDDEERYKINFLFENDTIRQHLEVLKITSGSIFFKLVTHNTHTNDTFERDGIAIITDLPDSTKDIDDETNKEYPVYPYYYTLDSCKLKINLGIKDKRAKVYDLKNCLQHSYSSVKCPINSLGTMRNSSTKEIEEEIFMMGFEYINDTIRQNIYIKKIYPGHIEFRLSSYNYNLHKDIEINGIAKLTNFLDNTEEENDECATGYLVEKYSYIRNSCKLKISLSIFEDRVKVYDVDGCFQYYYSSIYFPFGSLGTMRRVPW